MRAWAYSYLRQHLPQETRNRMKSSQFRLRRAVAPVLRRRYGSFDADELLEHLQNLLPMEFEVLMVHSSMDAMYPMFRGTAFDVLKTCLTLVGDRRTLTMPAFFFGGQSYSPEDTYRRKPVFDEAKTPSEMGLLTELFRRRKGVHRSLHPTHSICAFGPLADDLVGAHHTCGTAFGIDSPFEIMTRHKTVILGLGTRYFRCLTQVHTAEDILGERFPVRPSEVAEVPLTLVARDGARYPFLLRTPNFSGYDRGLQVLAGMMPPDDLQEWTFRGVPMFRTDAATVTRVLVEGALRGKTIYVPDRRPVSRLLSKP